MCLLITAIWLIVCTVILVLAVQFTHLGSMKHLCLSVFAVRRPPRLRAERAQAVLQGGAQRLPAGPATRQEGVQLRPDHAGQGAQRQEAHGGGHVHPGAGGTR